MRQPEPRTSAAHDINMSQDVRSTMRFCYLLLSLYFSLKFGSDRGRFCFFSFCRCTAGESSKAHYFCLMKKLTLL